jgi:hypothetical protein
MAKKGKTGISNRETAAEEAREREEFAPVDAGSLPPEDAGGSTGEENPAANANRQTSHKAGSRSIAQKEAGSRYPDRSAPPARKVAGAFGRETPRPADRDVRGTSHPRPTSDSGSKK